ncbi:cation:proton antiporter domain-containing protein [Sphingomonas sp. URHD0057]|uniref:cation:proton antiporter domain-containing protein n=1 Tax=Sphingomonas sp. URHD0057 TaxID=1380389 RepID=UPI00048FD3EE|nr:cation:proton antiporter [Sphingomonas sp. URHD0057]
MNGEFATSGFSDALVILGAAGIVIPAFARFRISPIIGFILIGMLVGPHGLGALSAANPWLHYVTISNPHAIEPFAELGIVLLLFSIGLELSFRRLWGMRGLVFGAGAAELLGSAIILGGGLYVTGQNIAGAIGLGLALALSSTAIVIPLVGTHSRVGRSALAMLLFEDLALVPIVFLLGAMAPQAGAGVGSLLTTLTIGVVTAAGMLVIGRILLPRLFAQAARTKSPELFLSACLLVVIVASLVTSAIGFSAVLGALIAGMVIAETDYRGEIEVITAPFRGLGLGIFLITVGMSVDFDILLGQWQMLLAALFAVLLIKALVTAALLKLGGERMAVAAEAGVLMSSPSETTLIVLGSAAAAQLITAETAAFWQIVTALGLTVTPLLARLGRGVGSRFAGQAMANQMDATLDGAAPGQVVILGFGRVGKMVADMLDMHAKDYLAIDSDTDAVAASRKEGYDVLFGDVSRPELIEQLREREPSALILTMDNPVLVNRLAKSLRNAFPDLPIVARARDTAHAAELYKAGASDAVPETLEASLQLSEAVLVDLGVAMGPVIASIHEKRDELRAEIKADAELDVAPRLGGRRLRDAG